MQPAYMLRAIRPAAFVRPAGQSYADYTNPFIAAVDTASGSAGGPQVTDLDVTDYGGTTTYAPDNTALYNAVASGLNTAGSTIASIIASGNRMEIARLQNATNLQIAQMNQQANTARAAGNTTLANQSAQQAQQMQLFAQLLQQRNSTSNTPMYILAGLAGLGIIGGIVYFATAKKSKANPSVSKKSEIPYSQHYVIGQDKFLSGWGPAAGKQNWVILPVKDLDEAEIVRRNAKARSDMRGVKIITHWQLERMRMGARHWSLLTKSDAGAWYSADAGFAARKGR